MMHRHLHDAPKVREIPSILFITHPECSKSPRDFVQAAPKSQLETNRDFVHDACCAQTARNLQELYARYFVHDASKMLGILRMLHPEC